jgi:ornithine--oxo-acid transaminase
LSGGFYPVSAVLSNNAVLGTLKPGQHGSTFGGNPLACAVARAALRVLVDEGMIENAALQGVRFLDGLRSIGANTIREVRGRGLMLAVELHPEAGGARRCCEALHSRGILAKDTHEHIIRVVPPLVITSDQVDWALDRFGATLRQDFSQRRKGGARLFTNLAAFLQLCHLRRFKFCDSTETSSTNMFCFRSR